jgi:hypothetical protein
MPYVVHLRWRVPLSDDPSEPSTVRKRSYAIAYSRLRTSTIVSRFVTRLVTRRKGYLLCSR